MALNILLTVIVLSIMIFIHEFGHYIVAKICKVTVHEFALGMGPAFFKKKFRGTLYSLRVFPIGGFTSMAEDEEVDDDPHTFNKQSKLVRFMILFAGSFFNIICGLIVVLFMVIFSGSNLVGTPVIHSFQEGAKSSETGLMPRDRIISINGYRVFIDTDIPFAIATDNKEEYTVVIDRKSEAGDTERLTVEGVQFPRSKIDDKSDKMYSYPDIIYVGEEKNFGNIITTTFGKTISYIRSVYRSLLALITGNVGVGEVSGPVGMSEAIGQAVEEGRKTNDYSMIFNMFAFLSINLGVMNLLPLPALDGGRIIFILIEAIIRKPVNKKYEGLIHLVGMGILMTLIIAIAIKDVIHLLR